MSRVAPLLIALLLAAPAQAAITCSVSGIGAAFGVVATIGPATRPTTNSEIAIVCQDLAGVGGVVAYDVALTPPAGADPAMKFGAFALPYRLYSDINRLTLWGDGTSGTSRVAGTLSVAGTAQAVARLPVYAQAAPNSQLVAGAYTDNVVVTANWIAQ